MELQASYDEVVQELHGLEVERETLLFQVDVLQDTLESVEELLAEAQREAEQASTVRSTRSQCVLRPQTRALRPTGSDLRAAPSEPLSQSRALRPALSVPRSQTRVLRPAFSDPRSHTHAFRTNLPDPIFTLTLNEKSLLMVKSPEQVTVCAVHVVLV